MSNRFMKSRALTGIPLFLTVFLWACFTLFPFTAKTQQLNGCGWVDAGRNNMSEGFYTNTALKVNFRYKEFGLRSGFLWYFSEASEKKFRGFFGELSDEFTLGHQPMTVSLLYRLNPYSELLRETNAGALARQARKHLLWSFGIHARIYSFTPEGRNSLGITKGSEALLFEGFNFIYSVGGTLKPKGHPWNLTAMVTSYDDFLLMQETNPMVMVGFDTKVQEKVRLYAELWYKSAGLLNIRVNYFGYHLRLGVLWNIL